MNKPFLISAKYKIPLLSCMAIGLVSMAYALFGEPDHGVRFWANFHLNTVWLITIALCGMVFIGLHSLGKSAWQVAIQRVPEAMALFVPVGAVLFLIVLAGLWLGWHQLFQWAHPHGDALLEMKKAYLNLPFFSIRSLGYLGGWIFFVLWWRRLSLQQDKQADVNLFRKSEKVAGGFMAFFALSGSMMAWDWLMSLDPHWFSTLYGWYVFSGMLVSGVAVLALLVIGLRKAGYLPGVHAEHLHDLGKYVFAFSIFWTYLWFSQYMLIWYGNLPEETVYFRQRHQEFNVLFLGTAASNFLIPFLGLMTRNAKRTPWVLAAVCGMVLCGHWLDFFLLIMPCTLGGQAEVGLIEIGMMLGFAGLFLWVVLRALSKAALVPVNHPYLKESNAYKTPY